MNRFIEIILIILCFGLLIMMYLESVKPDEQIKLDYIIFFMTKNCICSDKKIAALPVGSTGFYITFDKEIEDVNINSKNFVGTVYTRDKKAYICVKTEKGFILVPDPQKNKFSGYKVDDKTEKLLEEYYKIYLNLKKRQ